MRILSLKILPENGKPLKAFADVELSNGMIIREFRVIQDPGKRAWIACPQISWRDSESGEIKYRTVITLPDQIKGEIDLLILNAWIREREKSGGSLRR